MPRALPDSSSPSASRVHKDRICFLYLAELEGTHGEASSERIAQESLPLEPQKRLSNGRAPDSELPGQLGVLDAHSRRNLPSDNQFKDLAIDLIAQGNSFDSLHIVYNIQYLASVKEKESILTRPPGTWLRALSADSPVPSRRDSLTH